MTFKYSIYHDAFLILSSLRKLVISYILGIPIIVIIMQILVPNSTITGSTFLSAILTFYFILQLMKSQPFNEIQHQKIVPFCFISLGAWLLPILACGLLYLISYLSFGKHIPLLILLLIFTTLIALLMAFSTWPIAYLNEFNGHLSKTLPRLRTQGFWMLGKFVFLSIPIILATALFVYIGAFLLAIAGVSENDPYMMIYAFPILIMIAAALTYLSLVTTIISARAYMRHDYKNEGISWEITIPYAIKPQKM